MPASSSAMNFSSSFSRFNTSSNDKQKQQDKSSLKGFFGAIVVTGGLIAASLLMTEPPELKAEEDPSQSQSSVREEEAINRYDIEIGLNPLKEILAGKDPSQYDITIYQYQVCPFCCKVRAFLDFHQIPYKMVEVNPLFKSEIKFSKDYRKVPIVVVEGKINNQLNDSSRIITHLNDVMDKTGTMNSKDVQKWRKWVDNSFVHTLAPNIYRTNEEAVEAFEYISEQNGFGWWQKQAVLYGGSFTMYAVSKRLKKKYGIENEREAIFDCGKKWIAEAIEPSNGPFHGGNKPDLADLAVYGILTSIEGLRTFNELTTEVPKLGAWYDLMKRSVPPCSGTKINK